MRDEELGIRNEELGINAFAPLGRVYVVGINAEDRALG
jgi:hypothetical protein